MARSLHKLSSLRIKNEKRPGWHSDGGSLYLQVGAQGGKSWVFRYSRDGKPHVLGLGPLRDITPDKARERASECRKLLAEGVDPKLHRQAVKSAADLAASKMKTFKECADEYISAHKPGWKNEKHAAQWANTLRDYVHPTIGDLPVGAVDTELVLKCLKPIWAEKTETATRVRNRIELILDWSTAAGFRSGENPARWRGHLNKLLPPPRKVTAVEHFPALPYDELGVFMAALRAQSGTAARALEFLILTGVRSDVVRSAVWDEFDLDRATWTIPKTRMKVPREHRVPLSKRALEILAEMKSCRVGAYVFPGAKLGRPVSTLDPPMKRIRPVGITVHGFRSTLKDWATDTTGYPHEVTEMVLAHSIKDKTERAYRRSDMLLKRIEFMEEWSAFCTQTEEMMAI